MLFLKNLIELFYPKICVNCDAFLLHNEPIICTICRHDLPLLFYKNATNNKIASSFKGRLLIKEANSLLMYTKEGKTKQLIHALKYKNAQIIGEFLGDWLGELIVKNNQFLSIDCIVPVPLHPQKLKSRGYNQVDKFGKCLSDHLKKPLIKSVLLRNFETSTQTLKQRYERFENLNNQFTVTNSTTFSNKHVLLIDDVLTTGATLEACSKALLKSKNCTISILTMAYTTEL